MLICENYKMFKGSMRIVPKNPMFKSLTITGTWLYRPDEDTWYCNGYSYPDNICDTMSIKESEER